MKIFLDTGNIVEIARYSFIIDGVTTNPSLLAREKKPLEETIEQINQLVQVPISIEVMSVDTEDMVKEAVGLSELSENIVVKIPMTLQGIRAIRELSHMGIKTNATLIFSPGQAILAAKADATYASIFVGRLDDLKVNGMDVVFDTKQIYSNFGYDTKIITASIRSVSHVEEAAKCGSDIATIPPKILSLMFKHSLTDNGIGKFLFDWNHRRR